MKTEVFDYIKEIKLISHTIERKVLKNYKQVFVYFFLCSVSTSQTDFITLKLNFFKVLS